MAPNHSDANPLARHGGLSYLEIPAADPRLSASFYQHVLGWQIDPRGGNDFRFADGGGQLIGRFVADRVASREPGLSPIFYVNGIDDAVARVAAHGGEIVKAVCVEGDVRVVRIRDPAGNQIGLWELAR